MVKPLDFGRATPDSDGTVAGASFGGGGVLTLLGPVELHGKVTKVDWMNPHVHISGWMSRMPVDALRGGNWKVRSGTICNTWAGRSNL